jgi:hypothetical protein
LYLNVYRYIKGIMNQLGLSIREDAVGNIFGRWEGSEAGLGAVATGSHVDAIPFSGKYDGVVGVLGALEAIRMLKRCKYYLKVSYHFSKNLVLLVLPMLYAFSFIKYHDELPMELSLTQCIIQCTQVCNTHMGIRHSQFHYTA